MITGQERWEVTSPDPESFKLLHSSTFCSNSFVTYQSVYYALSVGLTKFAKFCTSMKNIPKNHIQYFNVFNL